MKQYILLLAALFVVSGGLQARKYNENDSLKLLNFMKQEAVMEDGTGGHINAEVILGERFSANWDIWVWDRLQDSLNFTLWVDSDNGRRIRDISLPYGDSEPYLSGMLDFSGCDSLQAINAVDHRLTGAKFANCEQLTDVTLMSNRITSVDFSGCGRLTQMLLDNNRLLPSGVILPPTIEGNYKIGYQQIPDTNYSLDVIEGELYVVMDFSRETGTLYTWEGLNPEEKSTGVFYFKYPKLLTEFDNTIRCTMSKSLGDNVSVDVECSFNVFNSNIEVITDPETTDAVVGVYLEKEDEITLATILPYDEDTETYFSVLPQGDYLVHVAAPGYSPTFFNDFNAVVTDWKKATIVSGVEESSIVTVSLIPENEMRGYITITTKPEIEDARMVIYQKTDNGEVTPVDTLYYVDKIYRSEELLPGDYIIAIDAPGYLFTYYHENGETVANWQDAAVVSIAETYTDVEVQLTKEPEQKGNVTISGCLKETGSLSKKTMARPFRNSVVVLQSKSSPKSGRNDNLYTIRTTKPDEETGEYSFPELIAGVYYISVEIAGFQSESIEINTEANKQYEDNNFVVNETAKTIQKEEITSAYLADGPQLLVYPNPVIDVVRVSGLEGTYTVKLINMVGQMIVSSTGTSPELTLNLNGKPSGMYLIRIESQGKVITRKLIKK